MYHMEMPHLDQRGTIANVLKHERGGLQPPTGSTMWTMSSLVACWRTIQRKTTGAKQPFAVQKTHDMSCGRASTFKVKAEAL